VKKGELLSCSGGVRERRREEREKVKAADQRGGRGKERKEKMFSEK